ncbi:MAG: TIM barrel protein [Devosia sp.]|nr:TIM barrel protein [Devosia sp.]
MRYSACIELLFRREHADVGDRIRAAKAAGMEAVEFWTWSNKDVAGIKRALAETGLPLAGILCEPIANITNPLAHEFFLAGVAASLAAAQDLGTKVLIAQGGNVVAGASRASQHRAIADCLRRAADIVAGTGVVIALEPLNDRVDHPGYYLTSTTEGLDIVDEVGRPEIRLLYDIYHAGVMGEPIDLLAGRVDRIAHVHLADTPGRHEPGTGTLDIKPRLDWLAAQGYRGYVGYEYVPTENAGGGPAFPNS